MLESLFSKIAALQAFLFDKHLQTASSVLNDYSLDIASKLSADNLRQKQPPEVLDKKSVLKNFTKFTGKHLCQSIFLIKLQACSCSMLLLLIRDSSTGVFL